MNLLHRCLQKITYECYTVVRPFCCSTHTQVYINILHSCNFANFVVLKIVVYLKVTILVGT